MIYERYFGNIDQNTWKNVYIDCIKELPICIKEVAWFVEVW